METDLIRDRDCAGLYEEGQLEKWNQACYRGNGDGYGMPIKSSFPFFKNKKAQNPEKDQTGPFWAKKGYFR